MNVEWRIDKGLPVPLKPEYGLTPEQRKKKDAAKTMRQTAALKAQGFCGIGGSCKRELAEGHSMCEYHLVSMRARADERSRERKAAGQCRQCERSAFAGMEYCLVHRKGEGLPRVVRQGINEFRRLEREREESERMSAQRDELRSKLHLLNDKRQKVLTLRYGLEDGRNRTLQEVGIELGVTRERVRQLEEAAMMKIYKGVPLPTKKGEVAAEVIETLKAMEVGDSVVCTAFTLDRLRAHAAALSYLITSRKQEDGQFRVWMVSKGEQPTD